MKLILALTLFTVFANASPLGILEVHPEKGAREIQSASILYLWPGSDGRLQVTYAVCKEPSRDFSKKCVEAGLTATLPWVEYDNEVLSYLKLDRYRVLRDIVNGGNESVQLYSNTLKPVADALTPNQSKQVETDLEKGVSAIETARAEMKQIQAKNPDYLLYNAILAPLQSEDVTAGVVREPIYSTVNDLSVKAALLPFRQWRSESICSCRLFQEGGGKFCGLMLNRDELVRKAALGPEDCDSREACLAGKWYRGKDQETSIVAVLNARCRGYFEARTLPMATPRGLLRAATTLAAVTGAWQVRGKPGYRVSFRDKEDGRLYFSFSQTPRHGVTAFQLGAAVCSPSNTTLDASPEKGVTRDTPIFSCSADEAEFTVTVFSPTSLSLRFEKAKAPFNSETLWDLHR